MNCNVESFIKSSNKEGRKHSKGFRKMLQNFSKIKSNNCANKQIVANYSLQLTIITACNAKNDSITNEVLALVS